ncbi:MAG: DNA alkylation repair protein [Bacillota bacterium]|nr:DNA alkylation repair protein [Bacillota bacterium]
MSEAAAIKEELNELKNPEKAVFLPKFFRAYPDGYGEGDLFLGIKGPDQRKIARRYFRSISLDELKDLVDSPYHEHRQTALFILVYKYDRAGEKQERQALFDFYLANLQGINNWDLVDSSAPYILGRHLYDYKKDRTILYRLAGSGELWKQRIAVLATFYFIKRGDFSDALKIIDSLLHHDHDLIHKATGWMLREIGKIDYQTEFDFLKTRYREMPRTMLRYAIEKFNPAVRKKFLQGQI